VLQRLTGTDLAEVPYRRAADINRAVLPLLDEVAANPQPFFLFVNYMDAHWPYRPPPPFDTKFGSTRARSIAMADYYRMASDVMAGRRTLTDTERADLHAQYDGGIANIDQQIGALVDRLEKLERLDNCLLIVTADHGEAFGEHALVEHGVSVYGDQIHVPLIVKYPRQRTPSRVRDAVSGALLGSYITEGIYHQNTIYAHPWMYKNFTLALVGIPGGTGVNAPAVMLVRY